MLHSRKRQNRGFTMVELMVVLVLLVIIAGFVVPNIIGQTEKAKHRAAQGQIETLRNAVDRFYLDTGKVPRELDDLVEKPADVDGWAGPYVKKQNLTDPWDNEWKYRNPGEHGNYDIYSYGADGSQGGDGAAKDITSWSE